MVSENKTVKKTVSLNIVITLTALLIIALIALSGILYVYVQQNSTLQDKNKQIASLQNQLATPKLVSIGLQYTDNRSDTNAPFLHITGYVVNVGTAIANNCTIHVTAIQSGNVTALDTSATIPSLEAGKYETINLQFPYTGQALEVYTSGLTWTN
ncbi:MAG: hypothetical protein ABSD42_08955 [Candidatus Bathyarchaeia archaeon]|jgi:Na+-transporting NADH:ubiquinone oxidoreductase subunit NqrC